MDLGGPTEARVPSYLPGGASVPLIPLNHPCATAMRPVVKLLWPLVIIRPAVYWEIVMSGLADPRREFERPCQLCVDVSFQPQSWAHFLGFHCRCWPAVWHWEKTARRHRYSSFSLTVSPKLSLDVGNPYHRHSWVALNVWFCLVTVICLLVVIVLREQCVL